MNFAKIILASASLLTIIGSAALAEPQTGMITRIDRLNNTIAIKPIQSGTVGANATAGTAEEFRAQNGVSLEDVHAGDRVTYSVTETGGAKTITKLEKKK